MVAVAGGGGPGSEQGEGLAVALLALTAADTVEVSRGRFHSGTVALRGSQPMLAPRCAAGCRITMGVGMALALLTMD